MPSKPTFDLTDSQSFVVQSFSNLLLSWDESSNNREMPWKGIKDPYRIWLSEIILQQTRVQQGLAYYEKFIKEFPDVGALASAPEEKVFRLWEGLGYYSRCRNLISSARMIADRGSFPDTHEDILQLKGVGDYTAAAIASFAFDLPHAVLDGNVYRVISRIVLIDTPTDTPAAKKYFSWLSQQLLDAKRPAKYNQAIMDFGSGICKPAPLCGICFFNEHCLARKAGVQNKLPVKSKKPVSTRRFLNYIIIEANGNILVRKRSGRDIWGDLYEFYLIESELPLDIRELEQHFLVQTGIEIEAKEAGRISQKLTHQDLNLHFIHARLNNQVNIENYEWAPRDRIDQYAFPKSLRAVLTV